MKKTSLFIIMMLVSTSTLAALITVSPAVGAAVNLTPGPVSVYNNTDVKEGLTVCSDDSGPIYIVWAQKMDGDNKEIRMSYSSNNGTTFSPPITVNNVTAGQQSSPESVVTGNGDLLISWQDASLDGGDIILARSTDKGKTFEEVHVSDYLAGTQSNPAMAARGDNVAVVWEEYRSDSTIRLWKGNDGSLDTEFEGHAGAVLDVEFSPGGAMLASASEDNTVKLWSSTGNFIRNVTTHDHIATAVNWSADGKMLATGSHDFNISIFNTTDWSLIRQLNSTDGTPTRNYVNAISFSPNSTFMAAGYNGRYSSGVPTGEPTLDFNVTVWNLDNNSSWTRNEDTPEADNSFFTDSVMDVAFSHDSAYLAAGSKAGVKKVGNTVTETGLTLRIWDSATSQIVSSVKLDKPVYSVAWSPDDSFVAAGLPNGTIAIVNISNPADIRWMADSHTGSVNSIDWHPTRYIGTGASDPVAKMWDEASGLESHNLPGHMNSIHSVDWSTDGSLFATAGGISNQYGRGENQIFSSVSDDGGQTFSSPVLVNDCFNSNRLRPDIGMDETGNISVVWYDYRNDGDIYFANSTDSGASFNTNLGIATLNDAERTPEIFVDLSGNSHIAWQQGEIGAKIIYANSSDGFANHVEMATAQVPSIAGSPDGDNVWVSYRLKDASNIYHLESNVSFNGGSNFTETVELNNSATLHSTFFDVYVDGFNQTYVAWMINNNIYFRTTVLEDTWAPRVVSTSPFDGEADVSIFTEFSIEFSEPMDRVSVEAAFSWTDDTNTWYVGDCVGNQGTWNRYGNMVSFRPDPDTEPPAIPKYSISSYQVTIGETAADLAGNQMGADYSFGFTTSRDVDPPMIEHSPSQTNVSYDQSYQVVAIVNDQWGTVKDVSLRYQGVGDASPINSVDMEQSNTDDSYYSGTIPAQLSIGQMYYYIEAADEFNNIARNPDNYMNQSQLYNVSVVDLVDPEISHVQITEQEVFFPIEIWAVVTDEISMDFVELNYRPVGQAGFVNVTMDRVSNATADTYSFTVPRQTRVGSFHYNITATDGSGNRAATAFYTIEIVDRSPPMINSVIPEHLKNETEVLVRANVTDDIAVDTVMLYFRAVGGDQWVSRAMQHVSGDIYEFTIPAQRRTGTLYYYVNATDTSGNQASTLFEQDQFQIEVVGVGADYSLYYVLGAVLAVLMVILVYLVVKRFSDSEEPSMAEDFPDDEVQERLEENGAETRPEGGEMEELETDAPEKPGSEMPEHPGKDEPKVDER